MSRVDSTPCGARIIPEQKCFQDDTTRAVFVVTNPNRHAVPHYSAAVNFNRNLIFSVNISFWELWRIAKGGAGREEEEETPRAHICRYSTWNVFNFSFKILALITFFPLVLCSNSIFRTLEHMLSLSCSTPRNHMLSHCKQLWWWVAWWAFISSRLFDFQPDFPQKYLNPLKQPESSCLVDLQTVDEIFFMVPSILNIHEKFLEELRKRLDAWDPSQRIGDSYYDVVSSHLKCGTRKPLSLLSFSVFETDSIRNVHSVCK